MRPATRALAEPASPAPAPVKNTEAKKAGGFSLNPFKKNEKAEKPAAGAPAAAGMLAAPPRGCAH